MRRLQTKVGRLQTKGQGIGKLVHSLGSMNLSPMIPDPNSHPRHYLFPLFVNLTWLY